MKRLLPALLAFGIPLLVVAGLFWPVPLHPGSIRPLTAFGDSHVWVFEHIYRWAFEGEALEPTCAAGYPGARSFRPIAGMTALLYLPLRPLLGPLATASLLQMLSLPLSSLVAFFLLRRWTGAAPVTAALCASVYALSPHLLGTLATGEISNTQAWIPPLLLLALDRARAGWRGVLATGVVGLLASFTSPYLGMALPLLAAGYAGVAVWRERREQLPRMAATLGALALGLLPAWFIYRPDRAGGGESIFQPARRMVLQQGPLPHPSPVAQLDQLLLGAGQPPRSPFETQHMVALGLPLLLAAGLVLVLRCKEPAKGRLPGILLAVGGVLLAVGPWIAVGGSFVEVGGLRIPGPVALLELCGWPAAIGGLYFRYVVLASLGLVLLVASGLRGGAGATLALALLLAQTGTAISMTGPFWPRPSAPLAGVAWLSALADGEGAALELPLQGPTDAHLGQSGLLRAVYHRRPTTALPRSVQHRAGPSRRLWEEALRRPGPGAVRDYLRAQGVGLVLLPAELGPYVEPDLDELRQILGEPAIEGELIGWDLGSATPRCTLVEPPRGREPR